MVKKDLLFIKRVIGKGTNTSIVRTVSCYVDINRDDIKFQDIQTFQNLDESELDQYCSFFKKGVSGKLGSTAIDLKVNENILEPLRDTELKDIEKIKTAAMIIRDNYAYEDNYSIFFAYGAADFPTNEENVREDVYSFVLALIQPCPLSKPGIKYDAPQNEFMNRLKEPMLGVPVYGFLYPALDEMCTDIDHAAVFVKNEKAALGLDTLVQAVFGSKIPLSPEGQKNGFKDLLETAFEDNVPFEGMNGIYDHLQEKVVDMTLSGEDIKLSETELADTIIEYGDVPDEKIKDVKKAAELYDGCDFSVSNLLPSKVNIKTEDVSIKVDSEKLSVIKRRVIDGVDYYLIPANSSTLDDIILANPKLN